MLVSLEIGVIICHVLVARCAKTRARVMGPCVGLFSCEGRNASLPHVQLTQQHDDQPESSGAEDQDEIDHAERDGVRLGARHGGSFQNMDWSHYTPCFFREGKELPLAGQSS